MGSFIQPEINFASLPLNKRPKPGSWLLGYDTADGNLKKMDSSGAYYPIEVSRPGISIEAGFDFDSLATDPAGSYYVVRSSFDLTGESYVLPENSIMEFVEGGEIKNIDQLTGDNSSLIINPNNIGCLFGSTLDGTWNNSKIYPEWFGSNTPGFNWSLAIQACLDISAINSNEVCLEAKRYAIEDNLIIQAGVTMTGVSKGETVFSAGPTLGTILAGVAPCTRIISIEGRLVTLSDMAVLGDNRWGGATMDGVVVDGVGDGSDNKYLLEQVKLSNMLMHSCKYGLNLRAGNVGAVTYSTFNNIRVRDCAEHLRIEVLSDDPIYGNLGSTGFPFISPSTFLNSNRFNGFYSSGYAKTSINVISEKLEDQINGEDLYLPANNLIFTGVVIEPPYAEYGHIIVTGGGASIRMDHIRIEALNQNANFPDIPSVYLGEGVNGCHIGTDQQGVTMIDKGYNNTIISRSAKASFASANSTNLFKNTAMVGLTIDVAVGSPPVNVYNLPEWTIEEQFVGAVGSYPWRPLQTDSDITMQYSSNPRQAGYQALEFVVPPKYQLRIYQSLNQDLYKIDNAKVHCYVIAEDREDVQWTYQDEKTPIIASGTSWGTAQFNGEYEPVGGWFPVRQTDDVSYYRIPIFIQNIEDEITGDDINFTVTQPQFVKGTVINNIPEKVITEQGGTFYGPIGSNVTRNILPITESSKWTDGVGSIVLPLEGNTFEFNETGFFIQRLNYLANKFPKGSQITLMFTAGGVSIVDGDNGLMELVKPFVSTPGASITLISPNGDGTWQEVSRYSKKNQGYTTYEIEDIESAGNSEYMEIPTTGEHYLNFTNINTGQRIITRINDEIVFRFDEETRLRIHFTDTNSEVEMRHSPYIELTNESTYFPKDDDWIELITLGDGTWRETLRKDLPTSTQHIGYDTLEMNDVLTGTEIVLSDTRENYYNITNTVGITSFNKINYDNDRFEPGTIITLEFSQIDYLLTLNNAAFIGLSKNGEFVPANGDWIQFITAGNGTWKEIGRNPSLFFESTLGKNTVDANDILTGVNAIISQAGENQFNITNTVGIKTITRINDVLVNRFDPGSKITLLFTSIDFELSISNSAYIALSKPGEFKPANGDWLQLEANHDGTWFELLRSEPVLNKPYLGHDTVVTGDVLSAGFLILPLTGETYFDLDSNLSGGSIQRINNAAADRFPGGTVLILTASDVTVGITFVNSAYLNLAGNVNFVPAVGDSIAFFTKGNGIWREAWRSIE